MQIQLNLEKALLEKKLTKESITRLENSINRITNKSYKNRNKTSLLK